MFYDPKSVLIEIIRRYHGDEVVRSGFLMEALYLVDWHHAVQYGETVTQTVYHVRRRWEGAAELNAEPPFKKKKIADSIDLSVEVHQSIYHVVKTLSTHRNVKRTDEIVYSTYPICSNKFDGDLNLVKIAKKFNKLNLSTRDKGFV